MEPDDELLRAKLMEWLFDNGLMLSKTVTVQELMEKFGITPDSADDGT